MNQFMPVVVASEETTYLRDRALDVVLHAFAADPPVRWLYPDDAAYAAHFPDFAAALGAPAFTDGTLGISEGAAAFWIAPGSEPDEHALGEILLGSVPGHRHNDAFEVLEGMGAHHPPEPHWYLPVIGTLPEHQGRGLGTALITPVLDICDRHGVPAYLEATTDRNRTLYARLGFRATGSICVADCPPITPMIRDPQHRDDTGAGGTRPRPGDTGRPS